ncbi:UNKNOWN [Stylonychia lemnae]|uniref:Uncharacterized protein n=1 Tax=Stylonychia lemnae TaxID=5949 RepID=A0A078B724_STYLE|nr:UNKNOWN [Stylonychia lemnae]|eukprot:CDW89363.1 UNKNOWN [Stylonychia lemnae]
MKAVRKVFNNIKKHKVSAVHFLQQTEDTANFIYKRYINKKIEELDIRSHQILESDNFIQVEDYLLKEDAALRRLLKRINKALTFIIDRRQSKGDSNLNPRQRNNIRYNNLIQKQQFHQNQFQDKSPFEIEQECQMMYQLEKNFEKEYLQVKKQHQDAQLHEKQIPKNQRQADEDETLKIRHIKDQSRQLDQLKQKIAKIEAKVQSNEQIIEEYMYKYEHLVKKEKQCVSVGTQYGLNFSNAQQAHEMIQNELMEGYQLQLINQLKIIKESIESMRRKYQTLNDVNQQKIQSLLDEMSTHSQKYFEMSESLNKRIKDFSLLKMSFEYKRSKLCEQQRKENTIAKIKELIREPNAYNLNGEEEGYGENLEYNNLMNVENESFLNSSQDNIKI